MPFTAIAGTFHIQGYSPVGDSILFPADTNDNWDTLDGVPAQPNARGIFAALGITHAEWDDGHKRHPGRRQHARLHTGAHDRHLRPGRKRISPIWTI